MLIFNLLSEPRCKRDQVKFVVFYFVLNKMALCLFQDSTYTFLCLAEYSNYIFLKSVQKNFIDFFFRFSCAGSAKKVSVNKPNCPLTQKLDTIHRTQIHLSAAISPSPAAHRIPRTSLPRHVWIHTGAEGETKYRR
jgi:hypothetical protein